MKVVHCIALCAAFITASSVVAAPAQTNKAGKDELIRLYLLSVAADRCGFAMTSRQADAIDRAAKSLAESLKLGSRGTDALYSEADIVFEKQGPKVCDRNGTFAKGFQETLRRIAGP